MIEEFKGQSVVSFYERFKTDEDCREYLYALKWKNGFKCPKCGHTHAWDGPKPLVKVCKSCRHQESATANTLFHKVKFGLRKAFIICFEMCCSSKGLSSVQMGKRLEIKQQSAWYFMSKVRAAMASTQSVPMEGSVEVDEFVVGGKETGRQGRSYGGKKKKATVAVELTEKRKIKRVYVRKIRDYSANSIRDIFERHIGKNADVRTDKWTSYEPLKKEWKIKQEKSSKGMNFKEMHVIISQIKSWIRCVPTHASPKYIQGYFDEYCYRINRSQNKETIFTNLIKRMLSKPPIFSSLAYVT